MKKVYEIFESSSVEINVKVSSCERLAAMLQEGEVEGSHVKGHSYDMAETVISLQ